MVSLVPRLVEGLAKTRKGLLGKMGDLINRSGKIDEEFYEELEEILISADVGVKTTTELLENVREEVLKKRVKEPAKVLDIIKKNIQEILGEGTSALNLEGVPPRVFLVVGVNGVGKTTTIGKLAYFLKQKGKTVLLAAGDTFRAAAIEQLEEWSRRAGAQIIKHQEGADAAAVAFDAVRAAKSRMIDVVIIDTAGRLQTKKNLMAEVSKIQRVVEKEVQGAPHEVLLILDATTGQNAVSQARLFGEAVNVTGLVLSKLDGTAKGGIVIAVRGELNVPVKFIGIGEQIGDLRVFNSEEFVKALFGEEGSGSR